MHYELKGRHEVCFKAKIGLAGLHSYCIGTLDVTGQQLQELAVCWNGCFRRIFGFKRHESVKLL